MEKIQASVFRFNPEGDSVPRYDNFSIPFEKGMLILDVLNYIYENLDGTLAFNHGCRSGHCGICAVRMNGEPKLACQTLAEPSMRIEPLENFPVIRDLVVDRSKMEGKFERIQPFLYRGAVEPDLKAPELLRPRDFDTFRVASRCIECLSCTSVCPSFTENHYEFAGPTVMTELARYAFDPRDRMDRASIACLEGLFNCLDCAKCSEVCPHHIPVNEIAIEQLRELVYEKGISPPLIMEIADFLKSKGWVLPPPKPSASSLMDQIFDLGLADEAQGDVALFIGCYINHSIRALQAIGLDTLKILNRQGVRLAVPRDQKCCGLPFLQTGAKAQAQDLIIKNIASFEALGIAEVLTICPGCGMTLKNTWPEVWKGEKGRPPKFRVRDLTEFLTQEKALSPSKMKEVPMRVSFHDPCHLSRGQGIRREPRQLISSLPGVEFIEMEESDRCCGGGGEVRATNRPLAQAVARRKVAMLKKTKIDAVVTTCPTCLLQLSAGTKQGGLRNVKVLHLSELIRSALPG